MATKIKAEIIVIITLFSSLVLGVGLMTFTGEKAEEVEKKTNQISKDYTVCEYQLRKRKDSMISGEVRPIPKRCIDESGKVDSELLTDEKVLASYMIKKGNRLKVYKE